MDPMKDDLGYLISRTSHELRAVLAEGLHNHGLDDASYIALFYTQRAGDAGISTRAMAESRKELFDAISETAQRLVRDGWVTEQPIAGDRESKLLQLTPKAVAVVPLLVDAAHWAIERALSGFSDEELSELTSYLERMRTNLR